MRIVGLFEGFEGSLFSSLRENIGRKKVRNVCRFHNWHLLFAYFLHLFVIELSFYISSSLLIYWTAFLMTLLNAWNEMIKQFYFDHDSRVCCGSSMYLTKARNHINCSNFYMTLFKRFPIIMFHLELTAYCILSTNVTNISCDISYFYTTNISCFRVLWIELTWAAIDKCFFIDFRKSKVREHVFSINT